MNTKSPPWFHQWFNEDYVDLYAHRDAKDAHAQITLIEKTLPLAGKHIIDVGCGFGRHVALLSEKGYDALGIDLSKTLIEIGQKRFPHAKLLRKDALTLPQNPACYDIALSLFTAFGYFDTVEENTRYLQAIHSCLAKNGFFWLDYFNPAFLFQKIEEERQLVERQLVERQLMETSVNQEKREEQQQLIKNPLLARKEKLAKEALSGKARGETFDPGKTPSKNKKQHQNEEDINNKEDTSSEANEKHENLTTPRSSTGDKGNSGGNGAPSNNKPHPSQTRLTPPSHNNAFVFDGQLWYTFRLPINVASSKQKGKQKTMRGGKPPIQGKTPQAWKTFYFRNFIENGRIKKEIRVRHDVGILDLNPTSPLNTPLLSTSTSPNIAPSAYSVAAEPNREHNNSQNHSPKSPLSTSGEKQPSKRNKKSFEDHPYPNHPLNEYEKRYLEDVAIYSSDEIIAMASRAGFRVVDRFGDYMGGPPSPTSPRNIFVFKIT